MSKSIDKLVDEMAPLPAAPPPQPSRFDLIDRAEKAERELAAARATIAEHVEENLSLHAECIRLETGYSEYSAKVEARIAETEAENARLEASHVATEELLRQETELRQKREARATKVIALLDRAYDEDIYVREARKAIRG